ncbi:MULTISPECIES: ATP-binding protein [unclassified Nocardioides]|uniref:sensor histidine kinase n=1 Tax=unclassified Nocardioides TaxID=2615069 RepID=UPI000056F283|nr:MULTISPECIES: ATP-binding protein [unclassified Nocardioides]ABL81443.1 ATP-binding region, ATPase domain protein [Nocardioides sp. JS614]
MGRVATRLAGLHRRLLFADDPDPELLQGVFAALFLLDFVLRAAGGSSPALASWPVLGLLVMALASAAAIAVPWERAPVWAVGILPAVDILALGFSRMDPAGGATGTLAVVPALWLGRQYGRRGAVVVLLSTAFLLAGPGLLYLGASGANLTRTVMIPLVATWAALAISYALERVRAGIEVIEHQRRVSQAIFDTVDVGLVLLDESGAYQGINRRHADFIRLAFPEGHQGRAGQLGAVYDADGTRELAAEEMPTHRASLGEQFEDVRIWVGPDPLTRRALSVSARRVEDEAGALAGASLAYKDVTDFMRALRVKDEFVASVSHELRTPLTSIVGYTQMLLERDDLPADVVAQLEVMARNSGRLHRLVADLLHTARLDEGGAPLVRAPVDLAAVVRDCVEAAAPAARRSGVELVLELPPTLVLRADQERLAQVVDNLVSNAVKYTSAGGCVQVTLLLDGDRAELCVADTGIGIAAADRDRLFTRFFRARQAEERSIQGVGLGLSITKAIVESHGGRIEVESELGRGSVFRVRLPLDA